MKQPFQTLAALVLSAVCALAFVSCEKAETPAERVTITFSETNTRGNTNGNIANLGMGAVQGEWIVFTDMGAGGVLKASRDGGKHCMVLMSNLNDVFACINLTGQRVDYISSLYGDINTAWLDDETALSLVQGNSYCLQTVEGVVYYIDESGDGGVYAFAADEDAAEPERIGSHPAYIEGVTDESSHPSFSVDGGFLYYTAADDRSRIYRVDLASGEEIRLSDASAAVLIADGGRVLYVDGDDRRLYSLSEEGAASSLTRCAVGTFNFDGMHIFYTDADNGDTVMRMSLSGSGATKLCDAAGAMYISLFGDTVMLYCVNGDGSSARNLFVSRNGGEPYSPG